MKMKYKLVVSIFVVSLAMSGCASVERNNADVLVEKEIFSRFQIGAVEVTNNDSSVIVSGTLRSQRRGNALGHIDLTFISTDGDDLYEGITDLRGRSLSTRTYNFRAELPFVVPAGSTVRVKYHRSKHI
ncbi:MAG: protein involved in sex pheromone biosynthesis [Enterobacterales bacterium]|jgi:protein involved in sex pheromone biosynthesis